MNGHRVQRHHRRLVLRVGCWRDFLLRDERKIGSTIKLNTLLSLRSTQALVGEHFKDSAYLLVHVISDIFNIYIILYHIYIYLWYAFDVFACVLGYLYFGILYV